eukprot:2007984-Pleurochrysis_carterae.AAC.1
MTLERRPPPPSSAACAQNSETADSAAVSSDRILWAQMSRLEIERKRKLERARLVNTAGEDQELRSWSSRDQPRERRRGTGWQSMVQEMKSRQTSVRLR